MPLELRDPVIYSHAGVPILPTNQRLVNFHSSPLVLSNLSPHRTAAYSPALELPRLRLTNLNLLPRGLMHARMKGAIQGTPGVDPRQLQLIPYGDRGSAVSVFEPGRRNRASNLLLGPIRRTRSYFDQNLIRPPGQIIQRRSTVLGTGGHEPYWYRRLRGPLLRSASVLPASRGQSVRLSKYWYHLLKR